MEKHDEITLPSVYGLNYATDLTVSLRKESMVNNPFCSDVTFIVGPNNKRIYAHKFCLVTASEYFNKMFSSCFLEEEHKVVVLNDTDPEIFLMLLRLVYGSKVDINDENIRDMFNCMQKYLLTEFTQPLSDFLISKIVDQRTAMEILRQNDFYNLLPVHERCMHFIQNNPLRYLTTEALLTLEKSCLAKILASRQINCTNYQLNMALEKWEKANPDTDTKELRKLIKVNGREYYSHKLSLLGQILVENQPSGERLPLKLKSNQTLSWYGIGLYVKSQSKTISISVVIHRKCIAIDKQPQQYRSANYITSNTNIHGLQIVDLMFEEVVLLPYYDYTITVYLNSPCDKYMLLYQPYFLHDNIKIEFPGLTSDKKYIPLAYLWAKYAECEMKGTQGTYRCCYTNDSHV